MSCGIPFMISWLSALFYLGVISLRLEDEDKVFTNEDGDSAVIRATSDEQSKPPPPLTLTAEQKQLLPFVADELTVVDQAMMKMTSEEFFDQYRDHRSFSGVPCTNKKCRRTVAIIGGGPVGLFTALELAKKDYEVTLLENAVYDGKWSKSLHFTRSQILLVQDAGGPNSYTSLTRLHALLPDDLWKELVDKSCGFVFPPARGTMTCQKVPGGTVPPPINSTTEKPLKLSISIRELQLIIQKALEREMKRAGGRVVFTHDFISFVDHRGHVFFKELKVSENIITPAQQQMKDMFLEHEWQACGVPANSDVMDHQQFARCWQTIYHPAVGAMPTNGGRTPTSKRIVNMIHGDEHPMNCKGAPAWTRRPPPCTNITAPTPAPVQWSRCNIDKGTWYDIRTSNELKPDILICADGKTGDCRSIVGLGKAVQKVQGLNPVPHKKNLDGRTDNAFAMLFQVGNGDEGCRHLLELASNGSFENLTARTGAPLPPAELPPGQVQLWPRPPLPKGVTPQHRFRAFPSRYYPETEEDFYFAAAITKKEYKQYEKLCSIVGKDKCEGYFGWPRSATRQIDFVDPCKEVKACGNATLAAECDFLRGTLLGILFDIMDWVNLPSRYRAPVIKNARLTAFKIFFLRAEKMAKEVTVGNFSEGVFAFAVGDAAMDVHFFSGSGVNIGLKAGTLLADLLGKSTSSPHYVPGNPVPDGGFEDTIHLEALNFAARVVPNVDATAAKPVFQNYNLRVPHAPSTWRDVATLAEKYHHILDFFFMHSHMDSSYGVLHAAEYKYPTCTGSANSCYVCKGASSAACPVGPGQAACLGPVINPGIALTTNQNRILDHIKEWGWPVSPPPPARALDAHRDTICAVQEAYER